MTTQIQLFEAHGKSKSIVNLPLTHCQISQYNPRITRHDDDVQKLAERIQRNGFEITRAVWAFPVNSHYEVFAGGTRFLAAQKANLSDIPVVLHQGFTEEEIVKLASDDNENDEYHASVPITDVWAEYARLKEMGWTGRKIAEVKGIIETTVSRRIKFNEKLPQEIKQKVCDGIFDEGHIEAIFDIVCDVANMQAWLTSEQAQIDFVNDILDKHRGSSAGVKRHYFDRNTGKRAGGLIPPPPASTPAPP